MAGKIKITQVKSLSGSTKNQIGNMRALGLRKIRHTVEKNDTPQIRGMITKIQHLVTFKEG